MRSTPELKKVGKEIEMTKVKIAKFTDDLTRTGDPTKEVAFVNLLTSLESRLAALQSEKNILLQGIKTPGTSPKTMTVEMIIPAVFHGDDTMVTAITFGGEEAFKEYLRSVQCGGLNRVDKKETMLVNSFAQLVPGGIYTHALSSKEAFLRVLGETRHLQQSREDEFAKALINYLQHAEPDQGYELRQDLRMQLTKDKKIAEHDVVVKGKDKAYIGSHKTYIKGAKPVKEIAARCDELAYLPNDLPAIVKPAIMGERVEPGADLRVRKACKDLNVVQFHRSGHAVQVVNRMGAVARLLRF